MAMVSTRKPSGRPRASQPRRLNIAVCSRLYRLNRHLNPSTAVPTDDFVVGVEANFIGNGRLIVALRKDSSRVRVVGACEARR